MGKLNRNKKMTLVMKSPNSYDAINNEEVKVFDATDNYEIYFRDAKFKPNGDIEAIYLGEGYDSLVDGYVRSVGFKFEKGLWNLLDSTLEPVKKAVMVAVRNNEDTIVIIKSEEKDDVNGRK